MINCTVLVWAFLMFVGCLATGYMVLGLLYYLFRSDL